MDPTYKEILGLPGGPDGTREKPGRGTVLGVVRRYGDGGVLLSVLLNRLPGADPEHVKEVCRSLYMRGQLRADVTAKRGAVRFYAVDMSAQERRAEDLAGRVLRVLSASNTPMSEASIAHSLRPTARGDVVAAVNALCRSGAIEAIRPGAYTYIGKARSRVNKSWLFRLVK